MDGNNLMDCDGLRSGQSLGLRSLFRSEVVQMKAKRARVIERALLREIAGAERDYFDGWGWRYYKYPPPEGENAPRSAETR